jgi:lipopolysaccharide transport system ATP-binding protein
MIRRSEILVAGQPLIELRQVSKRFSMHREARRSFQESFIRLFQRQHEREPEFWPLQDISFCIDQGDCVGIIGPNGSGKSTLLKLITGILEPTYGDILINGRIASLLELGAGFHPDLTGRENIFLNGSVYGLTRRQMQEREPAIMEFADLGEFIDVPIKHYSSGMYVRLGFAVAIHVVPDLLLVDEVLAVGDVAFQHKCLDSIQQFRRHGGTMLLVSHDLGAIQSICDRAIWLEHGRVRALGRPTDVAMAYLNDVAEQEEDKAGTQPLSELADGRRWGNGKVQITRVELCDDAGVPRKVFVNGGGFQARLHYRSRGLVKTPVFGLAIHSQTGVHICGPNTEFGGFHIPSVEGEGVIIYRVPELCLLEGAFQVSVAVVEAGTSETFDYHDRAYPFRVSAGRSRERYGAITLGGEWSMEQGSGTMAVDAGAVAQRA